MSEFTMPAHGQFCWSELSTNDAEAARKFYSELFGWQFKDGDIAGATYSEIIVGGKAVGGLFQPGP
ncbi:MAG TPA: hypothetical protein VEQ42_04265, partial [Pyrinomonadaceae bacterium]|nr:hypothetical protein [Pyrinomonadaceae bacterium]